MSKWETRNDMISEKIRTERTLRGISLAELSSRLKENPIQLKQLSKYERGESRWPADLVAEVALVLEVPVANLLTGFNEGETDA